MHKKILILLLILTVALSFVACKSDDGTESEGLNQELLRLLPDEGFQWAYFGADEYYHEMILENVTKEENQAIYRVKGEVEKVSNNSGVDDYSIDLYYVINNNSIVQNKKEEAMFDSEYDQITLIKTPLEKGTKWSETVKDKTGKKGTINAEIIEVSENDGRKEYKVIYSNSSTNYSEIRRIMEGYGVIAFTKSIEIEDEKYNYSYGLYGKNSGYVNKSDITNNNNDTTTTEESTETEEAIEAVDDETTEETTEVSIDEEKQNIKKAIEDFNAAWITYVNDNNQSFFDYVTKNGVAYKNAKNFNSVGLKEKFLVMNISSVIVNGDIATAKVYEEIEKTKDGEVKIAKYNWLYDLIKVDGKWLINGYTKQN